MPALVMKMHKSASLWPAETDIKPAARQSKGLSSSLPVLRPQPHHYTSRFVLCSQALASRHCHSFIHHSLVHHAVLSCSSSIGGRGLGGCDRAWRLMGQLRRPDIWLFDLSHCDNDS